MQVVITVACSLYKYWLNTREDEIETEILSNFDLISLLNCFLAIEVHIIDVMFLNGLSTSPDAAAIYRLRIMLFLLKVDTIKLCSTFPSCVRALQ